MQHEAVEKNIGLMSILVVAVISLGGLAEIVPLMFQPSVNEPIEGLEPLSALELEGRDIYIREGCVGCHSQMIRSLRAETQRYGHYSVAGEFVYDHPFLWGSKRTGPDLARVGGRYSDEWHRAHLVNPRAVVPESNMPGFPWLAEDTLDGEDTAAKMRALRSVGVPYEDVQIDGARAAVEGKKEMVALIAYLQQLGTHLETKALSTMDMGEVRGYITVTTMVAFLGVCWWAYRPLNRQRFERDAQLPFLDDASVRAEDERDEGSDR